MLTLFTATRWSRTYDQQRGAIPFSSNCSWCPLLQGITINEKSDNDYSARLTLVGFQTKTSFCNCCPPSSNQKNKMITKRIIKKIVQSSPNPSDTNSNQAIHLSKNLCFIVYICILVDCNSISRTQLKTSLILAAQCNTKSSFMKLTLEQLKLPMLWWMCMTNRLT